MTRKATVSNGKNSLRFRNPKFAQKASEFPIRNSSEKETLRLTIHNCFMILWGSPMKLHFCSGFPKALLTCASPVIPNPDENRGGIHSLCLTPQPGSPFLDQTGLFGRRLGFILDPPPANPMPGQTPQVRDDAGVKFLSLIRLAPSARGPACMKLHENQRLS